jgi:alginate O-acetyltransferase complex protein AlgI
LSVFKYDFLKYLKEYYLFFIVSILFSTRLPYKLIERIRNSVLVPILLLAIFSASIYCMYKGFDDPFLYFRF